MERSEYLIKLCPRCGKRLFEYRVDLVLDLRIYCKHCHEVVPITIGPEDLPKKEN